MVITIPNLLSLFRLCCVPFFITALVYRRVGWALTIFVVASVTDALDGYIAKHFHQKSFLGTLLDPLADKALLDGAFISLTFMSYTPPWLTITVVSRDLLLVGGVVLAALFFGGIVEIRPTILGKATTFLQILTVLTTLLWHGLGLSAGCLLVVVEFMAFGATMASGLDYIYRGVRALSEEL
jgi:cardiolipin synthase